MKTRDGKVAKLEIMNLFDSKKGKKITARFIWGNETIRN